MTVETEISPEMHAEMIRCLLDFHHVKPRVPVTLEAECKFRREQAEATLTILLNILERGTKPVVDLALMDAMKRLEGTVVDYHKRKNTPR